MFAVEIHSLFEFVGLVYYSIIIVFAARTNVTNERAIDGHLIFMIEMESMNSCLKLVLIYIYGPVDTFSNRIQYIKCAKQQVTAY